MFVQMSQAGLADLLIHTPTPNVMLTLTIGA
jgi:hypothetical protein